MSGRVCVVSAGLECLGSVTVIRDGTRVWRVSGRLHPRGLELGVQRGEKNKQYKRLGGSQCVHQRRLAGGSALLGCCQR
jgi:hypothetical protein